MGRRGAIVGAAWGLSVSGCNAIFGIDELQSDPMAPAGGTVASAGAGGGTVAASSSGSGGNGAQGGNGGAGGCAGCLVDRGLVVRYFIDEAESGQGPAMLLDAAPDPLPLTIQYGGDGALTFSGSPGKRGLQWAATNTASRALTAIDGTKIESMLDGSAQATIEMVVEIDDLVPTGSSLVMLGGGGNFGDLSLIGGGADQVGMFWHQGADLCIWNNIELEAQARVVLHAVLDATHADAAQRSRLYVNGMQFVGGDPAVANGEVVDLSAATTLVVGSGIAAPLSPSGIIAYLAYYNVPLSDADILVNAARLTVSDDTQ